MEQGALACLFAVMPKQLFSPKEIAWLVLFFLLLVCFPVTVLLPITLANPHIPAPGYVGRILPVLYTALIAQWVCYRCILRYCHFGLGFHTNGLLPHENFSPQTVHAMWKATYVAFVQLKSNRISITRESTELQLNKVVQSTPQLNIVVDLREKMRVGFQNSMSTTGLVMCRRPQSYFEYKLLSFLFPASPQDLQEWNSSAICRVSKRWWCWKRNIIWMVLFVGMVVIPLVILIPVSVVALQDEAPVGSNIVKVNQMSTSDFVAILVFSILFPVLYAMLMFVDLVLCCKRRFNRNAEDKEEEEETTNPPPSTTAATNNKKLIKVQFTETNNSKRNKPPRTLEGLQRANGASAQADLTAAFMEVDSMFKFEWSALTSSKRDATLAADTAEVSLLLVFQSLARFHKGSDTPEVRLIRAQALAGQIRFGIFSYLRTSQHQEEDTIEAIHDAAKQLAEEPNETILLDAEVLHSQFFYEIFCSMDFANEPIKTFELWEQEITSAFEHCNALLFGFQLLPSSDLEYVEHTFCRLIFRLMRAPAFPRKKELEYLAWIGYNRVRLAQKSNDQKIIRECDELHTTLLVTERERAKSGDAQRRKTFYTLVNHFQVKRSIFWLQMLKHFTQVEQLWQKYDKYDTSKQHVSKADYERLINTERDLQSDIFALVVIEVEKPISAAPPVVTEQPPIDLFSSQLWNSFDNKLALIDNVPWISFKEENWVENVLTQAQALEILLCFKQNMNNVEALLAQFHARFPEGYEDDHRIAFLFMWIQLVSHKTRVNQEWTALLELKTNNNINAEDTFRRGFSFSFEARFALHALYCTKMEQLHAQACAGLILMHIQLSQLEQAHEWAVTMQNSLPLRVIQSNKHLLYAVRELRRFHAQTLLGRFLFPWYWMCVEHTRAVTHIALFWLVVILPLVLGVNFVAHAQQIQQGGYFFLQWFGILLPVFYLLLVALRWTLVRRVKWFGEQEAFEELNEAVDMMLSAESSRGGKWWEGGEYPRWEMGEHVITAAEHRQLYTNKRGLRLVLQRMGLVLVCFALLPIVIIAPLLTLDWIDGAVRSALWVIIIALPICTCTFVLVRTVSEAVPRPVWHGIYSIAVWLALLFVLPLLCAPPLLRQQPTDDAIACLWIWLVCGPVLCACMVCAFARKHWFQIKYWCMSLTWDAHSLHEILHFSLQTTTLAASLFPVVSLLFLIGARASQGLQGGNSLFIAVAVFELLACVAAVAVCTIGIKLGYIHPEMAASSLLPVFYVSFGSFVMFECLMAATATNGGDGVLDGFKLQRLMDTALWCCGLQLLCAIWYAIGVQSRHRERKRFGYFPEDWELFDPTARFVVEEAKHVPFLSDAELNQTITTTPQLSRREIETMVEEALREEAQQREEEDLLVEQRITELRQRYSKQKLVELVFSQVLMAGLQQQCVVAAQFPVVKWRYSLLQVVRTHSRLIERFRKSTHLLQMVQNGVDMRIINMLFGVLHPLPFTTLQEFAWIDEDSLVDEPGVQRPDIIVRSLELVFCNHGGVRVLVFESKEQRTKCIEIIFQQTIARDRDVWVYLTADSKGGGIDRLQRKLPSSSNLA